MGALRVTSYLARVAPLMVDNLAGGDGVCQDWLRESVWRRNLFIMIRIAAKFILQ